MLGNRLKPARPLAVSKAESTEPGGPGLAARLRPVRRHRLFGFLLLAASSIGLSASGVEATETPAGVGWHGSIDEAVSAADTSRRQVLVLFTAAWSPASTQLRKHVLTDPDAVALLDACFEPVLIDVDDDPETTDRLGMKQVPGGCLLDAEGTPLSRFECPSSTGLFIATVARQLQRGATTMPLADRSSAASETPPNTVTVIARRPELANDFSTAGSLLAAAAATGPANESGSIGQIAAKVRGLSHFAAEPAIPQRPAADAYAATAVTASSGSLAAEATAGPTAMPAVPQPPREMPASPPATAAAGAASTVGAGASFAASATPQASASSTAAAGPAAVTPVHPQVPVTPQASGHGTPANFAAAPPQPRPWERSQQPARTAAPWAAEPGDFPSAVAESARARDSGATVAAPITRERPESAGFSRAVAQSGIAQSGIAQSGIAQSGTAQSGIAQPERSRPDAAEFDDTPAITGGLIEPEATGGVQSFAAASPWLQPAPAPQATTADAAGPETRAAEPTSPAPQSQEPAPAAKANPVFAAISNPFGMFKPQAEPSEPAQQPSPAATADYARGSAPATAPAAQDPMPLGLEGYCPVTLIESGGWVEGQASWGARHRGRTYLFRGLEEQQAFLADPDRYAPALSGDDPVAAFDAGTALPGERRYGVTYQQRIYLFASPESRATFAANPQRYTSRVQLAEQPTSGNAGTILR